MAKEFFLNSCFSAWNDGTIRAFASHNGQLHFAIHNAHTKAVSTVAVTNDGVTLISGGCDGQVIYYYAFSRKCRFSL